MDICYHEGKVVQVTKKKFGVRSCFDLLKQVEKKKLVSFEIIYDCFGIDIKKQISDCYVGEQPGIKISGKYYLVVQKDDWNISLYEEKTEYVSDGNNVTIKGIRFVDSDFQLTEEWFVELQKKQRSKFVEELTNKMENINKQLQIVDNFKE